MTSSFGGAVEKYKNLIVFAINGRNDVGFYTHNPATGETSSDAVVKVDELLHISIGLKTK